MSEPLESVVQVAPDGAGKRMRNLLRYMLQEAGTDLGTVQPVFEEIVQIASRSGIPIDFAFEFTELAEELRALRETIAEAAGRESYDAEPSDDAILSLIPRLWAMTTLPVGKAEAYAPVRQISDRFGRQIILPTASRDMVKTQGTTISASTAETPVLTAEPGLFLDLALVIITNTSASTSTRIDVRDKTGGSVLFSLQSVGGAAPIGFSLGGVTIPQTDAGKDWTMQCASSVTDIRIYAVAVKNR